MNVTSGVKPLNERFGHRLSKLQNSMRERHLNGIILVPGPNLRYYTGVNSLLLERPFLFLAPKDKEPHLVAPVFESGPYQRGPVKIEVHSWTDSEGPNHALQTAIEKIGLAGRWGLEGRVPFRFINLLTRASNTEFEDVESSLQDIRQTKDEEELRQLKRAASILSESFLAIPSMLKPGMKESELAGKFAQTIRADGADVVDDILVQAGKSSADPHHIASSRRIRREESVVIDTGCTYSGYYADITRTFIIGDDSNFEDLYMKVLEAQTAAIKESNTGVRTGAVDYAARQTFRRYGLDKFFIHRTGHGLGLEVHEAPYLVEHGTQVLQPNMAFTIEPGIYIPSRLGIRIEDNLLCTKQGHSVMTRTLPKDYAWWK
jgi:Xaa-Pro dipeptidase